MNCHFNHYYGAQRIKDEDTTLLCISAVGNTTGMSSLRLDPDPGVTQPFVGLEQIRNGYTGGPADM